MIIVGVDPGTAATGFGVLEQQGPRLRPLWYGCLKTSPRESASERLVKIHQACDEVILRFRPQAVAIEELYFGAGPRAALAVGQARGVCILAAAHRKVQVYEYAPAAIKRAVSGYGQADKRQVQVMVQKLLGMSEIPRPDHAADALAVAICHGSAAPLSAQVRRRATPAKA